MTTPPRKVFFYSDPHFGHAKSIVFGNRPFKNVQHMEDELIKRYNKVVGPNDVVYWLGDCFFMPKSRAKSIMRRLFGKKVLVIGNHDKGMDHMWGLGFDYVVTQLHLTIAGHKCILSHYPWEPTFWDTIKMKLKGIKIRYVDRRPTMLRDHWLIHGRTHSKRKFDPKRKMIHVGVDAWNFAPVPRSAVESIIKKNFGSNKCHFSKKQRRPASKKQAG